MLDDQGTSDVVGETNCFHAFSKRTKDGSVKFTHPAWGFRAEVFVSPRYKTPERELAGMMKSCAVTDNISPVRSKHLKAKKTASATGGDF